MANKDTEAARKKTVSAYFKSVWESKKAEHKFNQDDFAERLGVTQGAVGHYLNGRTTIDLEFVRAFCTFVGIGIEDIDQQIFKLVTTADQFELERALSDFSLERTKENFNRTFGVNESGNEYYARPTLDDYSFVPKTNLKAGMGSGAFEFQSEQIVDTLAFKTHWIMSKGYDPRRLALITCTGDSMEPTLMDGDMALVDLRETQTADGLFAIGVDEAVRIKRVRVKLDGSVTVMSDNARYDAEHYTEDEADAYLRVIGRVVWAGREFG